MGFWCVLSLVACIMSALGSGSMIIAYYSLKELKTFGNKMLMYVGMSNLIYALQTSLEITLDLTGGYDDDGLGLPVLCKIQAFISTYTSECVLIWMTILSVTIHDTVRNRVRNMAKREIAFIGYGFCIPLALSSIPFMTGTYGSDDGACWITQTAGRVTYQLQVWGLFYAPLWVCIIMNLTLILKTLRILKDLKIHHTETYKVIRRFLVYPLLWIVCWVCGTINRSVVLAGGNNVSPLMEISELSSSSQGLLTAILFFSDERIKGALRNRMKRSQKQSENSQQTRSDEECGDSEEKLQKEEYKLKSRSAQVPLLEECLIDKPGDFREWRDIEGQSYNSSVMSRESTDSVEGYSSINAYLETKQLMEENAGINNGSVKKGKKKKKKKSSKNSVVTQKKAFETSGQWNRMERIEEDGDEDIFDKEMIAMSIDDPDQQLFLSKKDTKTLFNYRTKLAKSSMKKDDNVSTGTTQRSDSL